MKEKLFEIVEESENISTEGFKLVENGKEYTVIKVSPKDKYGQAMIAYFYNMLCGENQQGLAVENKSLYFDNKLESYILKLGVHPTVECMCKNYENFRKNYKKRIKDDISRLDKIIS